jgi:hypothetical protein
MARIRRQPGGDQVGKETKLTGQEDKETWRQGVSCRRLSAFALLDLFRELRNDLEDVADDAKVGVLKDRRFRILINRDDELGSFHS